MSSSGDAKTIDHLVVICHGFWGNPTHLNHLRKTLLKTHSDAGIEVYVPKSNSNNHTYDGIDRGGERITHEILQRFDELKQTGNSIKKFSIVGYSLGGLIARYIVGLLYNDGFFNEVEPVNFTTFASPHLGVRSPKVGYQVDTWNWLGSNLLSVSGQQLYLTDNFRETGRPLLDILADPGSTFIRGLQRFEKRTLYANIHHDPAVPYYTACFSKHDPYVDLEAVDLHYLEIPDKEQKVILDPALPATPKATPGQQGWLSESTRNSLPFYAFAATVLPISLPLFLANAGYQTYQSAARVKAHETGEQLDLNRYRLPLFEETQKLQDMAVENLGSAAGEDYLPTPPPEAANNDSNAVQWPTLALTAQQFSMIEQLDKLGFTKFACHIRIRRAHACMIVRAENSTNFDEGKIICQHWADAFLT
ncbi:hypothetical protein AMS68_001049 [Peltaster fructicola]|uniref:DUF676 domain-containing protein n=1 Tax=Peltaster fructicola TaxID=286661 RepID=A0A6H0XLB0_9PEZI|nr:hypothetical protein AMS68_001049 [Peltaster fructicola]